jgi:serine protease Do
MIARITLFLFACNVIARPLHAQPDIPATSLEVAKALEGALVASIAAAEKSVAAIARGRNGQSGDLLDPQFVPHEYATGIVVDANGLILTNYHCLGDIVANDYVIWISGRAYSSVRVKAADPWTDLAILEIDAKDLVPIRMASSSELRKGSIVIALGNPHAIARDGNVSATWGIVSNLGRKIDGPLQGREGPDTVLMRDRETRYHYGGLIQTDAKLMRGTSGGPLLNLQGEMVGITTTIAALAGFQLASGYAIPVDDAFRRVLEKLRRGEEIEQGFLGVAPRNPTDAEQGVVVQRVESGTPANEAGLRDADEITRIDDAEIHNIDDLFFHIGSLPPDHIAQLQVRRGLREITVPVRLTKKPSHASRPIIATAEQREWRGMVIDYSTAYSLDRVTSLDPDGSVAVKIVRQDSPAWQAGLRPGALITKVNNQSVRRPSDFYRAVEGAPGPVSLTTSDVDGGSQVTVP